MRSLHKIVSALLAAVLLISAITSAAVAADVPAVEQEGGSGSLRATTVAGTLTGGQNAQIWLGLTAANVGDTMTLTAEWDRNNPGSDGLGFFVLKPTNVANVVNGGSLLNNNVAAGGSVRDTPGNHQTAFVKADGLDFTVIVYNNSSTDASFTLRVQNGTLQDDSGQVRDPSAPAEPAAAAPAEAAAEEAPAASAEATEAPAAETTPAEATATEATATEATAEEATPTPAPAPAVQEPFVLRAETVEGALPEQDNQHYLGLEPSQRDGEITLTLTFDPQDSSELARRLNFWVLDNQGWQQFIGGANPGTLSIASGNRTFSGQSNERVATFNAVGFGPYTVIVYNNSQVPATYSLTAKGALLIDDSRQTTTAQEQAPSAGTAAAATEAGATADASTTAASAPATSDAPAATTTTTGREGEPGGTYTVKSGDTIALIARDIYGNFSFYQGICTFNGLTDCNRIEVGDVLKLPTRDQINAGTTAPAATTTTAPAAATPAPTVAAAAAAAATPATPAAGVAAGTSAAATPAATRAAATPAATPAAPAADTDSAAGNTLVDVATENGNFTILIRALTAAGLDDELAGAGPYTVFAPTDAAFNALGAATVDALLKDTAKLRQVLLYHVVNGEVKSTALEDGLEAKTLQGGSIGFTLSGAAAKVQDSNIVVPDVEASNGVIHVIDKVMLPPAL